MSIELSNLMAVVGALIALGGLLLSVATFFLNLIYKELKDIRSDMRDLIVDNQVNTEQHNWFEERFNALKCQKCREK